MQHHDDAFGARMALAGASTGHPLGVDDPCQGREPRLIWRDFVRPDPAGEVWLESYDSAQSLGVRDDFRGALLTVRKGDFVTARRQLNDAEQTLRSNWSEGHSLFMVLRRVLLGAEAYYHYRQGDLTRASGTCNLGCELLEEAIRTDEFLMPFAYHIPSLRLQQAKVLRAARKWQETDDTIQTAWEMVIGVRPLCALPDGTPITVCDLHRHMAALPRLTEKHHDFLRCFEHTPARVSLMRKYLQQIFAIPWQVILY